MTLERGGAEEGKGEGAPVVRAPGLHASASAVSPLPAAVAPTVQIQMDRSEVRRARRHHPCQVEQHHARGLDLHSEDGDLRGRSGERTSLISLQTRYDLMRLLGLAITILYMITRFILVYFFFL